MTQISLLPKQLECLQDTHSKLLAYVGGLGSGKTHLGAIKTIHMLVKNNGEADALALEPNFPLITQVMQPAIEKALEMMNIQYDFKVAEKTFHININGNKCRLIMASAENWQRLIGLNLCFIWWDEMDTSKQELTAQAWPRLLGRLRTGNHRQLFVTTSPEGFKYTYQVFVTNKDKNHSHMIEASSLQNHFLPQDYFDTMYENYSEKQLEAWLHGKFVNLAQSSVFDFDRNINHADISLDTTDKDIYISCDFNAGGSVTLSALFIDDELYIFDEFITKNTFDTRDRLIDLYPTQDIWCAADASGSAKSSNSNDSNHDLLLEVPRLSLMQGAKNPSIQDSILSVNAGFRNKKIWIDTIKCPELTKALEQHAYTSEGKPEKFHTHPATDDFSDCIRYMTWVLMPLTKPEWKSWQN